MDIVLNQNSDDPIYDQIYRQISSQILNGKLQKGSQLPPIRTIANELKISVIPVKMAWEKLDHNNFIKTVTGRGTFVAEISEETASEKIKAQVDELAIQTAKKIKALEISFEDFTELLKKHLD